MSPTVTGTVIPLRRPSPRRCTTLVIIPCLDEGPRIAGLLRQLGEAHPDLDVLVIDDGSTDDTAARAADGGAAVVKLPFNLGYGAALQTGYKYALERGYERVVQMDGDGQHPVSQLRPLLDRLDEGDVDLVVGSRFLGRADYRIPLPRLFGIRLFSRLTSLLARRRITDPTSGLQAMNRRVFGFYQQDFYPYDYPDGDMLLRVQFAGLRFEEVPVVMVGGPPGKSMHSGLRPVYYVYKLLLSLGLTWLSGSSAPPESGGS